MSDSIYRREGDTLTVRPVGRLDTATSPVMEKEIQQYLGGIGHVVMDFQALEYISSGGLRLLLSLEQQLEDRGGFLEVIHVNDYISEVFEMVGFNDIVKVSTD